MVVYADAAEGDACDGSVVILIVDDDDDEEEEDDDDSLTFARASAVSCRVRSSSSTCPTNTCCCDSMCVSNLSEAFDEEKEEEEDERGPATSRAASRNRAMWVASRFSTSCACVSVRICQRGIDGICSIREKENHSEIVKSSFTIVMAINITHTIPAQCAA